MVEDRIVSADERDEDRSGASSLALRPNSLDEFIGQGELKSNLRVFLQAAISRREPIDHTLFYGPPGLGKTSLAQIISKEMISGFKMLSGPMIAKAGDLAAILTNLQPYDVLFIDEIHRLPIVVEEMLYPAMEDRSIDLTIGEGPAAKSVKIDLSPFTLVGATTRLGLLSNPLQDRFGITFKLDFYSEAELKAVLNRAASLLGMGLDEKSSGTIARSGRGTPRVALRLLKRIRDFAMIRNDGIIDEQIVSFSLKSLKIDSRGLDTLDYSYMRFISENYGESPVGVDTIAAGMAEDKNTVEDVIEPYLMQIGFVTRTPKGRVLTKQCLEYYKGVS